MKLYEIAEEYRALEAMLQELDEKELMLSMDTVKELLDPLNDQLDRKIEMTGRFVKNLEAEYEAVNRERTRLQKRETALKNQIESLKSYLLTTLENNNLQTVKGEVLKVRWQNNSIPSVQIYDIKVVPLNFLREVSKASNGVFQLDGNFYRLDGDRIMKADGQAICQYFKETNQNVQGCFVQLGKHVRIS